MIFSGNDVDDESHDHFCTHIITLMYLHALSVTFSSYISELIVDIAYSMYSIIHVFYHSMVVCVPALLFVLKW